MNFKLFLRILKNKILRRGIPKDVPHGCLEIDMECPDCKNGFKLPLVSGLKFYCPRCGKPAELHGGKYF